MEYTELRIENTDYIYAMIDDSLAYFGLKEHALKDFKKDFKLYDIKEVSQASCLFEQEIKDYYKGKLRVFKTPLYYSGTDFQKAVYKVLKDVPYGLVISYSELARRLGDVNKVRAVASAVGKNRHLVIIPCHRIISKSGAIGGFSSGLDLKRRYLKIEGINLWRK